MCTFCILLQKCAHITEHYKPWVPFVLASDSCELFWDCCVPWQGCRILWSAVDGVAEEPHDLPPTGSGGCLVHHKSDEPKWNRKKLQIPGVQ